MPRRGENIRKRKDGRWEGRIKDGNRYKSVYANSYSDVKTKMKLFLQEGSNTNNIQSTLTFKYVSSLWLASKKESVKITTIDKYNYLLESHINPYLGSEYVQMIDNMKLNAFVHEQLLHGRLCGKGGVSTSYIQTMMIIIYAILQYASEMGLHIIEDYRIKLPKYSKKQPKILSFFQRSLIENKALANPDPTGLGILLALRFGLRIGEVCALSWDDIDFENRIIYIKHTIIRHHTDYVSYLEISPPKSQSSVRELPLQEDIICVLKKLKASSVSQYPVSDKESFICPRTFEYRFHRALKLYGAEDTNFHTLRHTFATRCIEAGIDPKTTSELLGHSNVGITLNTYVHTTMEVKRTQMNKLIIA